MTKSLNQNEIDALLGIPQENAAQAVEEEDFSKLVKQHSSVKATPYNFKRPRLFSQDQMRVLNQVHEAFARDLSVYLSAQLRTIVDINMTAMDQVMYSEFVMSSAPPSALFVVDVVGRNQQIVFEFDPRLVIFTIEKLFGGPGVFLRRPRETSQIEQRIMSKVMIRAFDELEKAWKQVEPIELKEQTFESNAEFVQIIPGSEAAFVGTFEVTVYEHRSFINICYPYLMLERLLGRAGIRQWMTSATSEITPEQRKDYQKSLNYMELELRAELGRTALTVNELSSLRQGDVILLNQKKDRPITVYIGDFPKFKATAGRSSNTKAIQITEMITEPSDTTAEEHE